MRYPEKEARTLPAKQVCSDEEARRAIRFAGGMEKVGKDGVISMEEAKGVESTPDVVEGMPFDRDPLVGRSRAFPGLPETLSASC